MFVSSIATQDDEGNDVATMVQGIDSQEVADINPRMRQENVNDEQRCNHLQTITIGLYLQHARTPTKNKNFMVLS